MLALNVNFSNLYDNNCCSSAMIHLFCSVTAVDDLILMRYKCSQKCKCDGCKYLWSWAHIFCMKKNLKKIYTVFPMSQHTIFNLSDCVNVPENFNYFRTNWEKLLSRLHHIQIYQHCFAFTQVLFFLYVFILLLFLFLFLFLACRPVFAHGTVNNVGVMYDYPDELGKISEKMLWGMININIAAVTMMTRMVINDMKTRGKGAIINISSGSSLQPLPLMAVYAASKVRNWKNIIKWVLEIASDEKKGSKIHIKSKYRRFL